MTRKDLDGTALSNVHPSKILQDVFMGPLGLNVNSLARALHLRPSRMWEILNNRRAVSAETALRLAKLFGTSPQFWLYLQAEYDLQEAQEKWSKDLDGKIKRIDTPTAAMSAAIKGAKDDTQDRMPPERVAPPPVDLQGDEKTIFDLLSDEKVHFDTLSEKSGLPTGHIAAALTMLELDQLITRHPYDWYSRKFGR